MNYPTDPTYTGAYSTPPLGWYDNVSESIAALEMHFSEDVCQGNIIACIVGSANQSLSLGNTDAAFHSGPAYPALPVGSYAEASSSSSILLPSGFDPYAASIPQDAAAGWYSPLTQSDEDLLSRAFDIAFDNIIRSSIVPSFPSQPDTREEYYLPPSYVVPCRTSEPLEVDHCQQNGQRTFVGDVNNQGDCHPYLALPFPRSLHSPPLPIPGHLPLPPGIPTNHTRPFNEGKGKIIDLNSIQPHHDLFTEQDERLPQRYSNFPFPSK